MKYSNLKKLIADTLAKVFCNHTGDKTHLANFYGDAIIAHGNKRSAWKCNHCNAVVYSNKRHYSFPKDVE